MKNWTVWFVFATLALVSSLAAGSALANDQAKEVMAIHDVAMARMTEMHELKLQLREQEETGGKTAATSAAITSLEEAHRGMMQWMREYREPETGSPAAAVEAYLLEEKRKIEEIAGQIDTAIREAEKLVTE